MLRMSTLGRNRRSGNWTARKVIPTPVRPAYAAAFGRSWEEKFFQPAEVTEREARRAHAEWLALVEARISVVATETSGAGVDLTHKQAHALAGRWYRWKTERHGEEPGAPQSWTDEIKALVAGIADLIPVGAAAKPSASSSPSGQGPGFERFADLVGRLGGTQARVLDRVAVAAEAQDFLARERLALSAAGRRHFLCALVYELIAANALLARQAKGD